MRKTLSLALVMVSGGLTAALTSGCLGPRVLSEQVTHAPARNAKVQFYEQTKAPKDVLVVFDEERAVSENDDYSLFGLDEKASPTGESKIHRRAFYLFANQKRIEYGRPPLYVSAHEAKHLKPVPMFDEDEIGGEPATSGLYAVKLAKGQFQLERNGVVVGDVELPKYKQWLTARKLFLFPAAVGGDAAMTAAVAGAVYGAAKYGPND